MKNIHLSLSCNASLAFSFARVRSLSPRRYRSGPKKRNVAVKADGNADCFWRLKDVFALPHCVFLYITISWRWPLRRRHRRLRSQRLVGGSPWICPEDRIKSATLNVRRYSHAQKCTAFECAVSALIPGVPFFTCLLCPPIYQANLRMIVSHFNHWHDHVLRGLLWFIAQRWWCICWAFR